MGFDKESFDRLFSGLSHGPQYVGWYLDKIRKGEPVTEAETEKYNKEVEEMGGVYVDNEV